MQIVTDWKSFNFANHLFFNCSQEINTLIEPLVKYFGLNSFVFYKVYNDGSEIRLSNQPQWLEYFYTNELYQSSVFEIPGQFSKKQFLMWSLLPSEHDLVLDKAHKHGIDHGITFTNPCEDSIEFYFFGTTSGNSRVINKYVSNLDLLEKFTIYFKKAAKKLIEMAYASRLKIDHKNGQQKPSYHISESILGRDSFVLDIMQIRLTNRELDCAKLLAQGFTAKMIGIQLNLSFRTVEEYINQLKQKTGQYSKAELTNYLSRWLA